MKKSELIQRLQDIEWDDFEVKEAKNELPKNIWETVSAFSNSAGGWIVLGIRQTGKTFEIQGTENPEKLEQDFLGTLRSQKFNTRLSVRSKLYEIDGKKIIAFYIPSSQQKPVYFGSPGNTFIRMGSGDQKATDSEIMAMYHDQSFGIRSELEIADTDISMLNANSLHSYRQYLKAYNPLSVYEELDDSGFCKRMNICTRSGNLTYAGLLMFGSGADVLRYIPTFCMDYIEIPGKSVAEADTRYTYRIPEQENLWEVYQVVIRRLRNLVDTPFRLNRMGIAVDDNRQMEILREAWINMLMHTDHFSPFRSCIHVFSNRIEFINAGCFPISPERIYGTFFSQSRNPTIAKLFRFARISENAGFGLDKLRSWKQLTGMDVTIRNERDYALVTLMLEKDVVENVVEKLPPRMKTILNAIRNDRNISAVQLADMCRTTARTVQRDLNKLQERNLIKRTGPDKGGYWEIIRAQEHE